MQNDETVLTVEQKIARLRADKPNSLYIELNDWWSNDGTVAEAVAMLDDELFISAEDRQLCVSTESLWQVWWYPSSRVGVVIVCASSLDMALDALLSAE